MISAISKVKMRLKKNLSGQPDHNVTETDLPSCSNELKTRFQTNSKIGGKKSAANKYRRKTSIRKQWGDFLGRSCSENNL